MDKKAMIDEIVICCKANGVPLTGDLVISLAYCDEIALRRICRELHINTRTP